MTRKRRWLLINLAVVLLTTVPLFFYLRATLKTNRERALVTAVVYGDDEKVRELLDKGTSIDLHDEDGDTLLRAAIRSNHVYVVTLLEEHRAPTDPKTNLLLGAFTGRTALVRESLKMGVDPNTKDTDGDTALAYAGQWGHEEIVKLLIEHHADVNNTNTFGQNSLDWARQCEDKIKQVHIIAMLKKAGARVSSRGSAINQLSP